MKKQLSSEIKEKDEDEKLESKEKGDEGEDLKPL